MNDLMKKKALEGKAGPIGFMDLLPEEEKYGYKIDNMKGGVRVVLTISELSDTAETRDWER